MIIHSVIAGETVSDIAKKYGVDEEILRMNNGLEGATPAVGEELLVLTPTRTYTVRRGDSVERLALRFGVRRRELAMLNPWIERDGLVPGRKLALKYDVPKYGMGAANGYFYSGTTIDALRQRLSLLTYVTVASGIAEGGRVRKLFEARDAVGMIRSFDKIPLLRIYDKDGAGCRSDGRDEYIDAMIETAVKGGYKGITLGGEAPGEDFLVDLKKRLIGSDLILFTEVDGDSPDYCADYSDGCIFFPGDPGGSSLPFEKAEGEEMGRFAMRSEGTRCLVELDSFATSSEGYVPILKAIIGARRGGCEIRREGNGTLSYTSRRGEKFHFNSLERIKATLDALHEYGFMGISFDIMRTPIAYLMAYNAHFSVSPYTSTRSADGCSRG